MDWEVEVVAVWFPVPAPGAVAVAVVVAEELVLPSAVRVLLEKPGGGGGTTVAGAELELGTGKMMSGTEGDSRVSPREPHPSQRSI